MKIDRHTLTKDFAPFATIVGEGDIERIREAAVRDKFGEAGFYAMTVGDFTTVLSGDPRPLLQSGGRTVFDACRVEAFKAFVTDDLIVKLQRLTLPPTAETMKMNAGTLPMEFVESIYTFLRAYFGLPSFRSVDGLLVSELLQAKKDEYNRAVVDRNVAASIKKGGRQ
jgi:hypothetical protein